MRFFASFKGILSTNIVHILTWTLISTIVNILWCFWGKPLIVINEQQALYIFSTMAGVVSSMFGLTLTAYIFFIDKFKDSAKSDDTYYEATQDLIYSYFLTLVSIIVYSGITILMSILEMALFTSLEKHNHIHSFILNLCGTLFLTAIAMILRFGATMLYPRKLDEKIESLKKESEKFMEDNERNSQHMNNMFERLKTMKNNQSIYFDKKGSVKEFLLNYDLLEKLVISFANIYKSNSKHEERSHSHIPKIINSLQTLLINNVISRQLFREISGLRQCKNGLIHNIEYEDDSIPLFICDRLKSIYNKLNTAYDILNEKGDKSGEWNNSLKELNDSPLSKDREFFI